MTAKTAPKVTLWEFFQQLGKTFMLPVALLSFCGIMLGIGSSLSSHDVITLIPVLGNPVLQAILNIDDNALQKALIEKEKVAIMPGYTYGEEGLGFVRLNAGCPRSKLEKGVAGLINAIRAVR